MGGRAKTRGEMEVNWAQHAITFTGAELLEYPPVNAETGAIAVFVYVIHSIFPYDRSVRRSCVLVYHTFSWPGNHYVSMYILNTIFLIQKFVA